MNSFRQKSSVIAVIAVLAGGCAPQPVSQEEMARAVEGYIEDVNKLYVVDCLLPGQLRKLGSQMTYLSARRPIRTTAADCEVRGGEYVAYDRANYATALNVWLPKAKEGDATAQMYVGQIYEKGLGQPPNYSEAVKWYRKAADQGNAQAQINLGALYEKGMGVAKDPTAASNWYRKASGLDTEGLQYAAAPMSDAERAELTNLRASEKASRAEAESLRNELKTAGGASREADALREKLRAAEARAAAAERHASETQAQSVAAPKPDQGAEQAARQAEKASREAEKANREAERNRAEAERLRDQLRAAEQRASVAEQRAAASSDDSSEIQALRSELRATQQKLIDQQSDLRQSQDEIEKLRDQLDRQKAASPAAQNDPKLRELEDALHKKEAALKTQQAKINDMASGFDKERKKLKQELDSARKTASAAPANSGASDSSKALSSLENELHAKMDQYRKGSESLTALLTQSGQPRAQIDQRKAELQAQAKEISALKEKYERESAKSQERAAMQKDQVAQGGPRIEILDPQVTLTRGARTINLSPSAKELVGKIQEPEQLLSLMVNGKALSPDSGGTFRYPLNAGGDATSLKIVATDKKKRTTDLDLSVVTSGGSAAANASANAAPSTANIGHADKPGDLALGKFYALIIGNNQYSAYPALQTAVNDAQSIDTVLRERYGFSTKLLVNVNRHQIMTALNELHKKLKPEDSLLIYYAGHGEIDKGTQSAYWLPTDAEVGNPANWISSQSITEFLSIVPARHVMVVADSCYSGALTGSAVARLPDGMDESKRAKWLKVMASRKARTVLTSGGVSPVLDQGGGGHSVFANALLGVLRSNQKILEDYDIYRAVSGQVKTSASKAGFQQDPQYAPLQHAGHEGSPFFFVPEKV